MEIALVSIPVPSCSLKGAEGRFARAFFNVFLHTSLRHIPEDEIPHLWEIEKVNQGLLYLASSLVANGFSVRYYAHGSNPAAIKQDAYSAIRSQVIADLDHLQGICFYSITCNFHLANALATELRSLKPELILAYGGPHATGAPTEVLGTHRQGEGAGVSGDASSPFDFVGIGEGEQTVVEAFSRLRQRQSLSTVRGLAFKHEGRLVRTPPRPRLDPVATPVPLYSLAHIQMLPACRIFPVRGCLNSCGFCADPWRGRSSTVPLDRVADEVHTLSQSYHARVLYLGCEDFLVDLERAITLANVIKQTAPAVKWIAQCRVRPDIDVRVLTKLAEAGCIGLEFGIESADQKVLDLMQKNIRVEDAQRCLQATKTAGLFAHAYWMVGLPGETPESARNTQDIMLRWAEEGLLDTWEYKFYIPYPGTSVFMNPSRFGMKILTRDYSLYLYREAPIVQYLEYSPETYWDIYQAGLDKSATVLEAKAPPLPKPDFGVDLTTIENMF